MKIFITHYMCLIFIFSLINASEMQPYLIHLPDICRIDDAHTALQDLNNPFTKKERTELVQDLLTGNPLYDKGMFQLYINILHKAEGYSQIPEAKVYDYFLYRLSKYALQVIIALLKTDSRHYDYTDNYVNKTIDWHRTKIGAHIGILQSWILLYQDVQWFAQDENRKYLGPIGMLNYGMRFAFLLDSIRKLEHKYEFQKDQELINTLKTNILDEIGQTQAKNCNLILCSLFLNHMLLKNLVLDCNILKTT